jgi:hypothetical protein
MSVKKQKQAFRNISNRIEGKQVGKQMTPAEDGYQKI